MKRALRMFAALSIALAILAVIFRRGHRGA